MGRCSRVDQATLAGVCGDNVQVGAYGNQVDELGGIYPTGVFGYSGGMTSTNGTGAASLVRGAGEIANGDIAESVAGANSIVAARQFDIDAAACGYTAEKDSYAKRLRRI